MASNTIYLITGANRGVGFGLVGILLQRANTTVVATVRNETTDVAPLKALPKSDGSNLIITYLSVSSTSTTEIEEGSKALASSLKAQGIEKIDVLIANAGTGSNFKSAVDTTLTALLTEYYINTLGPISLYQSLVPFLKASAEPKFIIIGSLMGSIGSIIPAAPTLAYGVSKAGVHYAAKKIAGEEADMVVLVIHPGWVQTEVGQNFATSIGVPAPPMTIEQGAGAVLAQVDKATKTSSGTFVGHEGETIPW